MSDQPRDITLEPAQTAQPFRCINRLSQAVADLMESQATHNRNANRISEHASKQLDRIEGQLAALTQEVRSIASEQLLQANRIENALARAYRAGTRLDEIEDNQPQPGGQA